MKFDPDIHRRRSIRLRNYNYASGGMYFVTICTQKRAMLLGEVVGADLVSAQPTGASQVNLNDAGKMIDILYHETIHQFHGVLSLKHIIMPNHFHGIIAIDQADTRSAPTVSLGSIVQAFKSKTTVTIHKRCQSRPIPTI